MKSTQSICAFFPAYNDEETIESVVKKADSILRRLCDDYRIIIVDDKSPDRVGEIADRLAGENLHIQVIHHDRNRGYGYTLNEGFSTCGKDITFYSDGDGQFELDELKNIPELIEGYDAVIGYRINRTDGLRRIITSKVYNGLFRGLFGIKVRDVNCSFKAVKREALERIKLTSESGFVDAELVLKLFKRGFKVREVGVRCSEAATRPSNFFKPFHIKAMLREMLRARFRRSR